MTRETASRVKHYLDLMKGATTAIFESLAPTPVLIVLGGIIKPGNEFVTRTTVADEFGDQLNGTLRFDPNARVFPVTKQEGANPYSQMIVIGRTQNSDIQLASSAISKMHAFITWQDKRAERTYQIADGNSRNGTWLEHARLTPQKIYPLKSGDTIGLGASIFLRFLLPADFFAALAKMKSAS